MIAVVIPTYSRPQLIARALKSLFNQTYQDWRCVIVKNGRDMRPDYHRSLELFEQDERINVLYTPNPSLPRALNDGFRFLQDEYCAVLEDDDEWHPSFLERMVTFMETWQDVGALYCDQVEIHEGKEVNWVGTYRKPFNRRILLKHNWIAFPMVMFRRECLLEFDENCGGATDWDTWLRMSAKHKFFRLAETLVTHHWDGTNYCLQQRLMQRADEYIAQKKAQGLYTCE